MRKLAYLGFACLLVLLASPALADKVDVTGEWQITIQTPDGTFTPTAVLQQDGEKLSGTYKGRFGESKLEGSVKEKSIKWKVTINAQGQELQLNYTGTVESEGSMKGTVALGEMGQAEWTAKLKTKEK